VLFCLLNVFGSAGGARLIERKEPGEDFVVGEAAGAERSKGRQPSGALPLQLRAAERCPRVVGTGGGGDVGGVALREAEGLEGGGGGMARPILQRGADAQRRECVEAEPEYPLLQLLLVRRLRSRL
jgi:hypothetical protein